MHYMIYHIEMGFNFEKCRNKIHIQCIINRKILILLLESMY